jgi:hypothetical protein
MVSGAVIKVKLNGTISPSPAPKKHYLLIMMVTHKKILARTHPREH